MSNTLWSPRLRAGAKPIYRAIADVLEHDVESGLLREGARLPTHRELAAKLRVTPLTITRAYKEAARRGLIDSTVGRGTFVRSTSSPFEAPGPGEGAILDLAKNIVWGNDELDLEPRLINSLRQTTRDPNMPATRGSLRHRVAGAAWIARSGLNIPPERIAVTPGAQQAILAILAAVCKPGDTVLAEEWTYPRFGAIAGMLHLNVQPVALDEHGMIPQSLEKACRRGAPKAIFVVPNFQNPTGVVMPEKRRREIAAIARRHNIFIVEDDVYGFLLSSPIPPITTFAPAISSFVTSLSKSVTPSLRHGFAALPEALVERVTQACGAITAFASTTSSEIFTHLFESGAVDQVIEHKRAIVASNRRAAARALEGVRVVAHAMSPHIWIELPSSMNAHDIADQARERGVAVAPGAAFAIDRTRAVRAMRISIGATGDAKQLESALRLIASLLTHARMSTAAVV